MTRLLIQCQDSPTLSFKKVGKLTTANILRHYRDNSERMIYLIMGDDGSDYHINLATVSWICVIEETDQEVLMLFGNLISVKVSQESDNVVILHYTTEGLDDKHHPHRSTWIKVHSWHCPSCGKMSLITSVDVYEDNAGDQYICLHCGFGFMFMGGEYLDIPKAARDDLVAYYDV